MEDQYGMGDLRQFMNGRPLFPPIPQPPDLLSGHHRTLTSVPTQHYEMVMGVGRQMSAHDMVAPAGGSGGGGGGGGGLHHHHHHEFRSDSSTTTGVTTASVPCGLGSAVGFSTAGLEMEGCGLGGDGGTGRWPRQETLTLLEIRSRLDPKFKEANQKGPLWDEVSRIMSEEHGYQRSGKKCREKFENLYKYYKKTKEGKAGRQDGKHYRFFRQLEALYGETSNAASVSENHLLGNNVRYNAANNSTSISNQEAFQAQKLSDSLSLTNSSDFVTTSSEDSDLNLTVDNDSNDKRKKRKGKRSWKAKIRDFIDSQMRKLMEKQEAWLEKMMKTMEQKEQERLLREEEWRKQEAARMEKEHKFWANERAWIESRDAVMVEALQKLTGKELAKTSAHDQELMSAELQCITKNQNDNGSESIASFVKGDSWPECEITRLIQLRTNMEPRFQQMGCPEEILWEEIAAKMACLGYDRTPLMCKNKWDCISSYLMKCSKKRKENSRFCCYLTNESISSQGGTYSCDTNDQGGPDQTIRNAPQNDQDASPPNGDTGNAMHDGCYRYLMPGDPENIWENYGVKFSKGENQ